VKRALYAILAAVVAGCGSDIETGERPRVALTTFTERTELFVEFPALVAAQESPFAAHLTWLDDFRPVTAGRVGVILSAPGVPDERFEVATPQAPGIFRPVVTPTRAGERHLTIILEAEGVEDRHDLGAVTVHANTDAAAAVRSEPATTPVTIAFLKEQQWRTEFGTAVIRERTVRVSAVAQGTVRARADGEARIAAPLTGRLVTRPEGLAAIGAAVERDQVLATIAPRLATDTDTRSLELAVARARRDVELARQERQRLEGLLRQGAVAERRAIAARHEEHDAESDLRAAEHRLAQFRSVQQGTAGSESGAQLTVRAPIAGSVVEVGVTPGEFVEEGRELFHVVDLDRLWLEARIPEADVARVRGATSAWLEVEGFDRPFQTTRLVTFGGALDEASRTAPLIFEVDNAARDLRVGMAARVHVLTGESAAGPTVPVSAVVDDDGQPVVYVQLGGESFERRPLRLGIRDGDVVQVLDGLKAGERVVERGAYQVRLAAASASVPAHGHAH
jgi:membrane fusion protein, heavy metal efflux system